MNTSILKPLRDEAQNWWYHAQLRQFGEVTEAVKLEHRTLRSNLETIRYAIRTPDCYVSCGFGGTTVHMKNKTHSSYGPWDEWALTRVLVEHCGVTLIDIRKMPNVIKSVGLPMVVVDDPARIDKGEVHAMSFVHLDTYVEKARELGAEIRNHPRTMLKFKD
jgi:hypothetical protein